MIPFADANSGVWDKETVDYVSRLRGHQRVSTPEKMQQDEQIREMALRQASRSAWEQVVDGARIRAVDLDERDCVIELIDTEDDGSLLRSSVEVIARWRPQVKEARLIGGEKDGEVLAVPSAHTSLAFEQVLGPIFAPPAALVPTVRYQYVLGGWNARDRVWLFVHEDLPPL